MNLKDALLKSNKFIRQLLDNKADKNDIPEIPVWALSPNKPTYSADEVGACKKFSSVCDFKRPTASTSTFSIGGISEKTTKFIIVAGIKTDLTTETSPTKTFYIEFMNGSTILQRLTLKNFIGDNYIRDFYMEVQIIGNAYYCGFYFYIVDGTQIFKGYTMEQLNTLPITGIRLLTYNSSIKFTTSTYVTIYEQ